MNRFKLFLSKFLTPSQQKVFVFLLLFFALGKGLQLASYQMTITPEEDRKLEEAPKHDAKIEIDLRTAKSQELEMVPGIGAKTAAKIIELRSEFTCLEDLQMVRGIGPAKFAKMKDYFISFGVSHQKKVQQEKKGEKEYDKQAQTVDLNTAGIQDLTSVTGIGKVTAAKIMAYRQEHGKFGSTQDLLKIKGIGAKKLEKILPQVSINQKKGF